MHFLLYKKIEYHITVRPKDIYKHNIGWPIFSDYNIVQLKISDKSVN